MRSYDVIILTDKRYLEDSDDPYKHNVFYEDMLVIEALKRLHMIVDRKAWDDATFDWSTSKSVVFRTTWDYFDRFDEFSIWLTKVSRQTQLFNSEALIRWNIDKHYLLDLKTKDVHIAETKFIEADTATTLERLHNELGWTETVLKPCVSGAARHTYRLNKDNLKTYEVLFQKLIKTEAMMLQPFQHKIVSEGEISMMVFNGTFTHAILKKAKPGDFRVQDDFGGSVHNYTPTKNEITFAQHAVKACPELPIYARVDIFTDNDGKTALSELELIEPELWFRNHQEAAHVLAKAIKERLSLI